MCVGGETWGREGEQAHTSPFILEVKREHRIGKIQVVVKHACNLEEWR
jgi:hypothetical protein